MSRVVGLDLGTTTLCGCVLDGESGALLAVETLPNRGALPAENPWEDLQDPQVILRDAAALYGRLTEKCGPAAGVGITGQMHGILYLDEDGKPCSPLATWQDGRGSLPLRAGEVSYARQLAAQSGYAVASGYGAVTHYYNTLNGLVPPQAVTLCTIMDALAIRLGGGTPLLHASSAASLGLYDIEANAFDARAVRCAGMDPALFPAVSDTIAPLGHAPDGAALFTAIGDNQASFMGSVRDAAGSLLVNLGTGGQISCRIERHKAATGAEVRPYNAGCYLWVGSALCGGRAYALLHRFFSQVAREGGVSPDSLYHWMEESAGVAMAEGDLLQVRTTFDGTRQQPQLRGGVENLGAANFTPGHLAAGVMAGVVEELALLYEALEPELEHLPGRLVLSGNALRKNRLWRRLFAKRFGLAASVPVHHEEAAFGAALGALVGLGDYPSVEAAQRLVQHTQA